MESFYGGRKGISFTLVKSFNTIEEMDAFFYKGPATLGEVGYGEYVIIDTIVNNHLYSDPDNGKIYRRGYEGAEYVGQIVGPKGDAPELEWTSYTTLINSGKEVAIGELSVGNGDLVPGLYKKSDGSLGRNKTIKYVYADIKNKYGDIIGVDLGLQIPYTSFTFDTDNSRLEFYQNPQISRMPDSGPFYEHWTIALPRGITGDDIRNLEMVAVEDATLTNKDNANKTILQYQTVKHEIGEGDPRYDKEMSETVYLADYNVIDNVIVQDDGTIVVKYTAQNNSVFEKVVKWIKDIQMSDTGVITVNYNNSSYETLEKFVTWVTGVSFNDNGQFTMTFNNSNIPTFTKQLVWVRNIELNNDGTLTVIYNTGDKKAYNQFIRTISKVDVHDGEDEDQIMYVTYNTDNKEYPISSPLNYVREMAVTPPEDDNPFHLYVYYAAPTSRGNITHNGKTGWVDLGYVRGKQEAIGIIGELESTNQLQQDGAWLNPLQVQGGSADNAGWGYTIGEDVWFYDYYNKAWYTPGKFASTPSNFIVAAADEDSAGDLYEGGIWMVTETSQSVG